jgi:hypothetical protein
VLPHVVERLEEVDLARELVRAAVAAVELDDDRVGGVNGPPPF